MTYLAHHTTKVSDTRRVRWVVDTDHVPDYDYDTEEETQAAVNEEQEKLNSGEWIALGAISEVLCPHCSKWKEVAEDDFPGTCWGIVTEPDNDTLDALAADVSDFPDEPADVFQVMLAALELVADMVTPIPDKASCYVPKLAVAAVKAAISQAKKKGS